MTPERAAETLDRLTADQTEWQRLARERDGTNTTDAMVQRFDDPEWRPWQA